MRNLSDEDVEAIADKLVDQVKKSGHEFWIDPKAHYDQHQALENLLKLYNSASNAALKVLVALLIIGGLVITAFAAGLGRIFGK